MNKINLKLAIFRHPANFKGPEKVLVTLRSAKGRLEVVKEDYLS